MLVTLLWPNQDVQGTHASWMTDIFLLRKSDDGLFEGQSKNEVQDKCQTKSQKCWELANALSKKEMTAAIFLLDYTFPQL